MTIFGRKIPSMVSLLFWIVIWEIIGQTGVLFLIPPFSDIIKAGFDVVGSNQVHAATWLSLKCLLLGVGIALVIGIPLGILMARIRLIENMLRMWINVFVSAPLTALVPLLMVLLGIGNTTVIVTVVLFALWIVVLDTYAGVKHVSQSLVEMAHSFGASKFTIYTRIIFWAALPEILTGVRMGVIRGVRGLIVGQLLVSIVGVGELFELYSRNFLMDYFWALVIILFVVAYLLSEGIAHLERRVEYYAGSR